MPEIFKSAVDTGFPTYQFTLNVIAVIISLAAVVYWAKLYRKLDIQSTREKRGWLWMYTAALAILLFNVSGILLLFSDSNVYVGTVNRIFKVNLSTLGFLETLSRTLIGLAMTVGVYLIYAPMAKSGNLKYRFVPVTPVTERLSEQKLKYDLKPGAGYLVMEERPIEGGSKDYFLKGSKPSKSISIFLDLVTHGVQGLCITRIFPKKFREEYGIEKTPILWLSTSSEYNDAINPSDLVEISHTVREFVRKSSDSVILLDGIEYLITQNSYDDVLKLIEAINDTIAQSRSRLIIPVDGSALDEQQLHRLERELNEITSIWKI